MAFEEGQQLHAAAYRLATKKASRLVWNISGFSNSFLVASCSFHFGVTMDFSVGCVRSPVIVA